MPRLCSSLLLSLLIASSGSAVTMDWTYVGNPGNPGDPNTTTPYCGPTFNQRCGAVGYAYNIGTYEVTNAQYAGFLNAKAASDPYGLYAGHPAEQPYGGITRSGSAGGYTYGVISGSESWPVALVDFYDALRFANWMNNGQGSGDTESGAYTLLGGTATPSNGTTLARNAGATIVLPSQNEWYKAAYYDPSTSNYFAYPANSSTPTTCATPSGTPNTANCGNAWRYPIAVGSYSGSPSPSGTFDQGGNLWEWNEARVGGTSFAAGYREIRGGSMVSSPQDLAAARPTYYVSPGAYGDVGFRLVMMVPEPSTGLLVIGGLLSLAGWRRVRG